MAKKKTSPYKNEGYTFDVPLLNKDKKPTGRFTKMRIKTVFKFSPNKYSYYLERFVHSTKEWVSLGGKLFDYDEIKKYFKD
ncbi:MAG: hypothetical protein JXR64_02590 [Spirochaetales bacterium]|nr:hypothetical protein [Spirochaetales bacterium]